jgi:hypothetical protein
VLIRKALWVEERPCILMDLVDLAVDGREELGVDKVNKVIVDTDYNRIERLRCIHIHLKIHQSCSRDGEECSADSEVGQYHYCSHFAYVVIVVADDGLGSYPALHPDGVLQTGSSLADSSGVWGVEDIEDS